MASRVILLSAIFFATLGLVARASTPTSHPGPARYRPSAASVPAASPPLTADKAMCKTFNANIGNGGQAQIAQALMAAGSSVSPQLAQDITKAITGTTLHGELKDQVKVLIDCTLVKTGRLP